MESSEKRCLVASISIIAAAAIVTAAYLLYSYDSITVNPNESQNRTRTRDELLFGDDPTIECGKQLHVNEPTNVRIVGGRPAIRGEFPWHAILPDFNSNDNDKIECGASVIGNRWLLTAAQCVMKYDPATLSSRSIYVGTFNLSSPEYVILHYEAIFIHPNHTPKIGQNDIALIKTVEKIDLTDKKYPIGPVCLPGQLVDPSGDATVVGFGAVTKTGEVDPEILQVALMPILNISVCSSKFPNVYPPKMCVGYEDSSIDTCLRDQGGSLVQFGTNNRATLVGIVLWMTCASTDIPSLFTQVSYFVDWIFDTIEKNFD